MCLRFEQALVEIKRLGVNMKRNYCRDTDDEKNTDIKLDEINFQIAQAFQSGPRKDATCVLENKIPSVRYLKNERDHFNIQTQRRIQTKQHSVIKWSTHSGSSRSIHKGSSRSIHSGSSRSIHRGSSRPSDLWNAATPVSTTAVANEYRSSGVGA